MVLSTAVMIAGGILGGAQGLGAGASRARDARTNFGLAEDYLDHVKKSNYRNRVVPLVGNLSMTAMMGNKENKGIASAADQASGEQANALGMSGLSGGTPFYNLDKEIINRQQEVVMQNTLTRMKVGDAYNEGLAGMASAHFEEAKARAGLMQAGSEYAYADSFLGRALPAASGALSGMQMANSVMQMGLQSKILNEDFLATDLFGGIDLFGGEGKPPNTEGFLFKPKLEGTPLPDKYAIPDRLPFGLSGQEDYSNLRGADGKLEMFRPLTVHTDRMNNQFSIDPFMSSMRNETMVHSFYNNFPKLKPIPIFSGAYNALGTGINF